MIDQEILELLRVEARRLNSEMVVLDLGCGRSTRTRLILEQLPSVRLGLVDHNQEALAFQRRLLQGMEGRVRFIQADLNRAELSRYWSEPVQAVLLTEVLEHLEDPGHLVWQVASLLRPQRMLVVSVPVGWTDKLMRWFNPRSMRSEDGQRGHHKFYTRETLLGLLQEADFRTIQCGLRHSRYFAYHLVLNLFRVPIDQDTGEVQPSTGKDRLASRLAAAAAWVVGRPVLSRILDHLVPRNYFVIARRGP